MAKHLALVIGVSLFANACSPQDTGTEVVDSVSVEENSSGPENKGKRALGPADRENASDTSVEAGDTAAEETTALAPETGERTVDCKIMSGGEEVLNAPCQFLPQSNGGFTLASTKNEGPVYGRILNVSVSKTDSTTAEVRGMTTDGINSRWGQASRSKRDPACWTGSDFSVCAY